MIQKTSYVLKNIDASFGKKLKAEVLENAVWEYHWQTLLYILSGPLKEGKTFWVIKKDHDLHTLNDVCHTIPHTLELVKTLGDYHLGRFYFHMLKPGQKILPHNDADLPFIDKLYKRYQIFFDIPDDIHIILDDGIRFDNSELAYSILDFDLRRIHQYQNKSQFTFIFGVIDLLQHCWF